MDNEFVKGSAIVGIGNVTSRVLALIFFVIVARMCSTEDYGYIRYVISFSTLAAMIVTIGFPTTLVRYLGKAKDDISQRNLYFSNIAVVTMLLFIITIIVLFIIGKLNIEVFIVVIGLTIVAIYSSVIIGIISPKKIASFTIGNSITKIVLVILLFYILINRSPLPILVIFSLSCIIPILIIESFKPTRIKFRKELISKDAIKMLSKFAIPMAMAGVAVTGISTVDIILIEHYLTLDDVGFYSVAKTLTIIFIFVPQAFTTILMPKVASFSDKKKIIRYAKISLIFTVLASFGLFLLFYFFGTWIIEIVFTAKYLKAMDALIILSIGMVFASIERIIGSTWIGVGKPVVPMKVMGIAAVVNLASNIYFIPRLGIFGAGLSFTLAYLSALIIWYGIIFRKYLKSYKD